MTRSKRSRRDTRATLKVGLSILKVDKKKGIGLEEPNIKA